VIVGEVAGGGEEVVGDGAVLVQGQPVSDHCGTPQVSAGAEPTAGASAYSSRPLSLSSSFSSSGGTAFRFKMDRARAGVEYDVPTSWT
jgi:hypothetical protein